MLILRLQRTGTKNSPSFRVVLAQSYRSAGKKAIEVLGHYNPGNKQFAIKDQERLNYWISQHVAISPTVHNLLIEKKLLNEKKVKAWSPKKKDAAEASAAPPVSTTSSAPTASAEEASAKSAADAPAEASVEAK